MIKFKILSTEFKIDFSFFMFMALIFMTGESKDIIIFFVSCVLHELGHLTAMCIFGAKSRSVYISGLGVKIIQSRENMISTARSVIILLSGAAVNYLIFILADFGMFSNEFSEVNLVLFIFNMLPFRNLDGGSILLCIGELLNKEYLFEVILKIFALLICIIIFVIIYIYGFSVIPASAVILYYCFCELICN